MASASGAIRKQLGPAKKRLDTRLQEALALINDKDVDAIKTFRPKLNSNLTYLNGVLDKLQQVQTSDVDKKAIMVNWRNAPRCKWMLVSIWIR